MKVSTISLKYPKTARSKKEKSRNKQYCKNPGCCLTNLTRLQQRNSVIRKIAKMRRLVMEQAILQVQRKCAKIKQD